MAAHYLEASENGPELSKKLRRRIAMTLMVVGLLEVACGAYDLIDTYCASFLARPEDISLSAGIIGLGLGIEYLGYRLLREKL